MSLDFWAGYLSGAAGIVIGNPLDLIKVRLQARAADGPTGTGALRSQFESVGALIRGAPAPILGYGALNALLFVSYNRTLITLGDDYQHPLSAWKPWLAGAIGGLATWVVSAPTELIKCRAQLSSGNQSSWSVAKEMISKGGLRGLYFGGVITSLRDSIGYGFYFWSYELSKRWLTSEDETNTYSAVKVLLCGGVAGVITWASIFPLDVIKTRVQVQALHSWGTSGTSLERGSLLDENHVHHNREAAKPLGAVDVARQLYRREGARGFFRGLGVCSARAFVVNAVQWAIYEWIMRKMKPA